MPLLLRVVLVVVVVGKQVRVGSEAHPASKGQSVAWVRGERCGAGEVNNEEITNCTLRANARRDGKNGRTGELENGRKTPPKNTQHKMKTITKQKNINNMCT